MARASWGDIVEDLHDRLFGPEELTHQGGTRALDVELKSEWPRERLRPWLDERLLVVDQAHVARVEGWLVGSAPIRSSVVYHAIVVAAATLRSCGHPSYEDVRDFAAILVANLAGT